MTLVFRSLSFSLCTVVYVCGQFLAAPPVAPIVPVVQPASVSGFFAAPHMSGDQGAAVSGSTVPLGALSVSRKPPPRFAGGDVGSTSLGQAGSLMGPTRASSHPDARASAHARIDAGARAGNSVGPRARVGVGDVDPLLANFDASETVWGALLLVSFLAAMAGIRRWRHVTPTSPSDLLVEMSSQPRFAAAAVVSETSASDNTAAGDDTATVLKPASFIYRVRNNFLTGIVVIAPVGLTAWLIWSVIGFLDSVVRMFVPIAYQPETVLRKLFPLFPHQLRGLGIPFLVILTSGVGWLAKGLVGRWLIRLGEGIVNRMPVVRSVYSGLKQIAETVLAQDRKFEKACIVEYPRKGVWSVGFITAKAQGELQHRVRGGEILTVFLPTTPNPTSGFSLLLPAEDVIELDMSVEDAAKWIISAGLVYPDENGRAIVQDRPTSR